MALSLQRIAAFSDGASGGNPAGVVLCEALPGAADMQAFAAELGYSETVFAAPESGGWRTRYFSPAAEVAFCGHATIALGIALGAQHGLGIFSLYLNQARITVEALGTPAAPAAALQSPPTRSRPADEPLVAEALSLFGLGLTDLDPRMPPAMAHAGADHLVLALRTRGQLAAMRYDFDSGRALARREGIGTFSLVHAEDQQRFHVRNPFPIGGVYEDPATGAAAAALAGYLRDLAWPHGGRIMIAQGDDMGVPCRLVAEIPDERGSSIRVSGQARLIVA
jgi:PhzF family phenazine biosynthesis protein